MPALEILKKTDKEPEGYLDRPTVKGVVFDLVGKVALFGGLLPGGGVEKEETDEAALKRECLEEIGCPIEIVKELGIVVQYRDYLKKKYLVHGYMARAISSLVHPTTDQEDEIGRGFQWVTIDDAIASLEKEIHALEEVGPGDYPQDIHQARLYNRKTSLIFLKEAKK